MEEKDAIELLNKLGKFMKDTTEAIKDLQMKVHNLKVDADHFKKNAEKSRIIISN